MRVLFSLLLGCLLAGCCCPRPTDCCPPVAESAAQQAPAPKAPQAEQPAVTVRERLAAKRIKGLKWEEANFDEVLSYLRTVTGFNFYLTPRARDEKFEDLVITLQVDDVDAASLLDMITEPFDLRWELRNGVIFVLVPDEVE